MRRCCVDVMMKKCENVQMYNSRPRLLENPSLRHSREKTLQLYGLNGFTLPVAQFKELSLGQRFGIEGA